MRMSVSLDYVLVLRTELRLAHEKAEDEKQRLGDGTYGDQGGSGRGRTVLSALSWVLNIAGDGRYTENGEYCE